MTFIHASAEDIPSETDLQNAVGLTANQSVALIEKKNRVFVPYNEISVPVYFLPQFYQHAYCVYAAFSLKKLNIIVEGYIDWKVI
jgi:hypothetical protein